MINLQIQNVFIQGSYCKIYTATWSDGIREKWRKKRCSNSFTRI
jgi:hypothetical protein